MIKHEVALKRIIGYATAAMCGNGSRLSMFNDLEKIRAISQESLETKEILFPTDQKHYTLGATDD